MRHTILQECGRQRPVQLVGNGMYPTGYFTDFSQFLLQPGKTGSVKRHIRVVLLSSYNARAPNFNQQKYAQLECDNFHIKLFYSQHHWRLCHRIVITYLIMWRLLSHWKVEQYTIMTFYRTPSVKKVSFLRLLLEHSLNLRVSAVVSVHTVIDIW